MFFVLIALASAAPPSVTVTRGKTQALLFDHAGEAHASSRLLFPEGLEPGAYTLDPDGVRVGNSDRDNAQAWFPQEYVPDGPRIDFTVPWHKELAPGSYDTFWRLEPKDPSMAAHELQITFKVPAPEITVVSGTVAITQERTLLPFLRGEQGDDIALTNTGMPVWKVTVQPAVDDLPTGLDLVATPKEDDLVSAMEISVTPRGDFPLGKTTGKLLLRGQGLAAPVEIPFEVHAAYPLRVLFGVVLLGVAVGFIPREVLPQLKAGEALAAKLATLRNRLKAEAASKDTQHKQTVTALLQQLDRVPDGAGRQAAVDNITQKLDEAEAALRERAETLAARLQALKATLQQGPKLAPETQNALRTAHQPFREATAALDDGRFSDGLETLNKAEAVVSEEVWRAFQSEQAVWQRARVILISDLLQKGNFSKYLTPLEAALSELASATRPSSDLSALVRSLVDKREAARRAMDDLLIPLERLSDDLLQRAGGDPEAWHDHINTLTLSDDVMQHTLRVWIRSNAMFDAISQHVTSTLLEQQPDARAAVLDHWEQGAFRAAVDAAVQAWGDDPERPAFPSPAIATPLFERPDVALPSMPDLPPISAPDVVAAEYAPGKATRRGAWLEVLISILLLEVLAYMMFGDAYVGRASQHFSIFFWAATSQLSITALLAVGKALQPS